MKKLKVIFQNIISSFYAMNTKKKIEVAVAFFCKFASVVSGILLTYILIQSAGAEIYGELLLIISSVQVVSLLTVAKPGEAVLKYCKDFDNNNQLGLSKLTVVFCIILDQIFAIFTFIVIILISPVIAKYVLKNNGYQILIIIFSLVRLMQISRSSLSSYLLSEEKFNISHVFTIIDPVGLVIIFGTLFFLNYTITLEVMVHIYLLITIFSTIVLIVVFVYFFYRKFKSFKITYDVNIIKRIFRFLILRFFATSFESLYKWLDSVLIGIFMKAETVALYNVLKRIYSPLTYLAQPIISLNFPILIRNYSQNMIGEFKEKILNQTVFVTVIGVFYYLLTTVFLQNILEIFNFSTEKYYYLISFSIFILNFSFLITWWSKIIMIIKNPNWAIWISFIRLFSLLVYIPLLNYYELIGLACGIIFSELVIIAYWYRKLIYLFEAGQSPAK